MATRLFSTLVNRIAPSAPGCPIPIIEEYARNTAREVCERTLAWRYIQADITLVAGTFSYAFTPPADTEVHAVLSATINDARIETKTAEQVIDLYPYWPSADSDHRSQPLYYTQFDPDTFVIAPTPDAVTTYTLNMVVVLKPLKSVNGMDEAVLDDLEDVIMHGALQRILVLPESTWSDREAAAYHAKQYSFKTAERRARVNLGAGRASLSVRMTPLA